MSQLRDLCKEITDAELGSTLVVTHYPHDTIQEALKFMCTFGYAFYYAQDVTQMHADGVKVVSTVTVEKVF